MSLLDTISLGFATLFLLYTLSYYVLLFIPSPLRPGRHRFRSMTVIVPARNEEACIQDSIRSIITARFTGTKRIIVVDDASVDDTFREASAIQGVTVLRNRRHMGKSWSLNRALSLAKGDLVAVVDGDSVVAPTAFEELARDLSRKGVAASAAVVKVRNRRRFINPWVHLELLYNSLIRSLFARINANVVTPGALSLYRRTALMETGGFSVQGFSEDLDIAIRLVRKGYKVSFCDAAVSETNMPADIKGFARQRSRLARGLVHALKRHMQINTTAIDVYTLPLFLFIYVQAIIMGSLTIYQIVSGYMEYFVANGAGLSFGAVKFFLSWFSLVGFLQWTWSVLTGNAPLTILSAVAIASTFLSYPLFIYAILRYDRDISFLGLFAFVFMFPYWMLLMLFNVTGIPEIFTRHQYNRWKKNER